MKKFICLLLVLVTFASALCSCGNGENNAEEKAEKKEIVPIPLGLKFGMSFEEADALDDIYYLSELKAVDDGKHFISFGAMIDEDHEEFFEVDWADVSESEKEYFIDNTILQYMLVFNNTGSLCSFDFFIEMENTPNCAQYLFNHYVEYYEKLYGVESEDHTQGNLVKAIVKKDNIEVVVDWEVNGAKMEINVIVTDSNHY